MKSLRVAVLFFTVIGGLFFNESKAQSNLTIRHSKVPLQKVIRDIENKTGYTFFINETRVNVNTIVSVNEANASLATVLKKLLAPTNYTYDIIGKQILIRERPPTAAGGSEAKRITGSVLNALNQPMGDVTVSIEGTTLATRTQPDGRYSIEVPGDMAMLVFTYMSYTPQAVSVKGHRIINITMTEERKEMEEVVVVGYGTQSKKSLTGAVSTVDMKTIETNTQTTISHALAGKAAGLRVNQVSAQPGGEAKLRIRGEGSINAGNDPLIVIDGFPISPAGSLGTGTIYKSGSTDNILESLNPDDIESVSVLKDAASTAIYGARAGHGVIIITTKRGKAQKAAIAYSGNMSVQQMGNNYQMLNAQQYMDMRNKQLYEEYLKVNGLGIYEGYITPPAGNVVVPFTPMYTNDQILNIKGTDWLKEITRRGFMHQHNISLNGGTENTKYMTSVNFMQQDGIVKNNGAGRFSARVNLDQFVNRYLSLGISATYSQNRYDNVPLGDAENEYSGILTSAIQANPVIPVYDPYGNYYIDPFRSFVPNPVSLLEIKNKTSKDRLLASAFAVVKPLNGLELKLNLGADRKFQKNSNYLPKTTLEGQKTNGSGNISQEDAIDYLMDVTANYARRLGEGRFKGLAGYSYQQFNGEGVSSGNRDFLIDGFGYYNLGAGSYEKPIVGSWGWKSSIASYFTRLNYSFKDRYTVEATLRADGASNFTPENRWGYFPSISMAWTASQEPLLKSQEAWLSNLKLRVSYGQTGNSNIGYHIQDFYSVGRNAIFGESETEYPGVYASELGNAGLTWETTTEYNWGVDLGFLHDKITLTAEVFSRRISDLLSSKKLLSYNEVSSIAANIGETKSNGYELTLNTKNIDQNNFGWASTITASRYNDRWSKRDPDWKPSPYQKTNDPIRAWWSYEAIGIMRPGEEAPAAQKDLLPGMVKLKDQNSDGIINENDMIYMDSGDPKLIFGFNNALRYKNFDLNIYFYGEAGRRRGASYLQDWTRMNNGQNVSVMAFEAFNSANTNSNNPTYLKGGYGWGDYYVTSVSFARLGNITLGYKLPVKKSFARSARIYANINNPVVFTNWTGLDPETDNGTFPYPNIRSYNIGLNITF